MSSHKPKAVSAVSRLALKQQRVDDEMAAASALSLS